MSKKELVLETSGYTPHTILTGTVTATAATNLFIGAGTLFLTELAIGDLIGVRDSTGYMRYYTVATIPGDGGITVAGDVISNVTAGSPIYKITVLSPYIIGGDPVWANVQQTKMPIYNGLGASTFQLLTTASGSSFFDRKEGLLLKSVFVRFPYQYTMADTNMYVELFYVKSDLSASTPVALFGDNGRFWIPRENGEIEINLYIPPTDDALSGVDTTYGLGVRLNSAFDNQFIGDGFITDLSRPSLGAWMSRVNEPTEMEGFLMPVIMGTRVLYGLTVTP